MNGLDWKKNTPDNKPDPFVPIMVYIPSAAPLPTVAEAYIDPDGFFHPHRFLGELFTDEVTHWAALPEGPKTEPDQNEENKETNTKILYFYRDEYNFKTNLEEVVKGTMSSAEKESLFKNKNFVFDVFYPWKFGFTDVSESDDPDDYHELVDVLPTKEKPTVDMTIQEFIALLQSGEAMEWIDCKK